MIEAAARLKSLQRSAIESLLPEDALFNHAAAMAVASLPSEGAA
jgi:hypothetical protein